MCTNHATLDQNGLLRTTTAHHTVTGERRTRIDAQNDHSLCVVEVGGVDLEIAPDLLHVVKLLERFYKLEQ